MPSPLSLPDPSIATLTHAPLQLVVCQVRHERNLAAADASRVLAIQTQLERYPRLEEASQQEIGLLVGPAGPFPLSGNEQKGWRLHSDDGAWTIALLPDFFALECRGYTSWTEFRDRFHELAIAVCAYLQPSVELRLGLRYVDRIELPQVKQPKDWAGFINERLLGPLLDDRLGSSLGTAQQLLQLDGPDDTQVLFRHGTQPDQASGSWPYLFDTDCFRSESQQLTADKLLSGANKLHRLALQLFQASVTPQLIELLAGGEDG